MPKAATVSTSRVKAASAAGSKSKSTTESSIVSTSNTKASIKSSTEKSSKTKSNKSAPLSPLEKASQFVQELSDNLAILYNPDATLAERIAHVAKAIYDHAQKEEPKSLRVPGALDELLVDGFDSEQIWEELRLHSDVFLPKADSKIKTLVDKLAQAEAQWKAAEEQAKQRAARNTSNDEDAEGFDFDGEEDFDEDGFDGMEEDDFEIPEGYEIASDDDDDDDAGNKRASKNTAIGKRKKTSEVDDEFFSLEEMERFADLADAEDAARAARTSGAADSSLDAAERRAQSDLATLVAQYRSQAGVDDEDEEDPLGFGQGIDISVDPGQGRDIMYDDFFLPPVDVEGGEEDEDDEEDQWDEETREFLEGDDEVDRKRSKNSKAAGAEVEDDEEDDDEEEQDEALETKDATEFKSTFELQQEKLRASTEAIEKLLVAPKAWDLVGETQARDRTKDALLEKHLEVEYATKMAEPITEEISMQIEEIIRSRCRDGAFDDVQPRVQPTLKEFVPQEEVSSEKSKYGLAEIYEQEYMKQALGTDAAPSEAETKRNATQVELSKMLAEIFHKLDALSNFTYTPLPATTELMITTSTPAIAMEEVLPMGVSEADRTAPQELYQAKSAGLHADSSEMSHVDKQRALRARQDAKAKHFAAKEEAERAQALAGNKKAAMRQQEKDYQKRYKAGTQSNIITKGVEKDATKYSTSTAFFTKMQENEQTSAARKAAASSKSESGKKSAAAYMG